MAKWVKTTEYGDYSKSPTKKQVRIYNITHIIRQAKALGICGKHVGSKPIRNLLKGIAKAQDASKKFVKEGTKEIK